MAKVVEDFAIKKDSQFLNKSGESTLYHGSADVKGIKAGDGRMYVMDLLRLSPRDANFPDPIKHDTCVLRSELIG
jgi:protein TIF31